MFLTLFCYFEIKSDAKQNKGSILKASVDYIMRIKLENDENKKTNETNKYLMQLNKKLLNRIKDLEMICRSNGLPYQVRRISM